MTAAHKEARAHHNVPQCWLLGFTDTGEKDGMLYVTDLKRKKQWRCKPSEVGHRRDFNRVDDPSVSDPNAIEKIFAKTKQPYAIAMKDAELFAFAGLWDTWKDKASGQTLETYTVITTDPNELMEPIHNRMPVILHRQDYDRWLEPSEPSHLPVDLLRPYPAEEMKAWRVSNDVGNVRNNRPS